MAAAARLALASSVTLLAVASLHAQMGDGRDAAGMVQKPPPAEWVRPAPQLSPQESLKTFSLPPGFHIELVAAEPLVHEPVALDFDPDGRLWVVEMRSYMPDVDGKGENQRINRIVVLEDTDKDGRMDKSTVYMDGLGLVRTVKVLRNGVLVGDPPNLWFTRDTDGDGKADEKTAIATDFSSPDRNPEEGANALIWGLDNWIVGSSYKRRLRLRDGQWISENAVVRGQWGQTMDDYGRLFTSTNEDYFRGDLISNRYPPRNPNFIPSFRARKSSTGVNYQVDADETVWPVGPTPGINRGYWKDRLRPDGTMRNFDAGCGPAVYRGDNFPGEFYGNYFSCEPAGHLVRRAIITEQDGILSGRNAYEEKEFLRSTDERFRPVNVYTAPDGSLYVVDLHRGILQHRQYMTTYLRNQIIDRKLDQGLGDGRIYRIVHDGKKPGAQPALSRSTPAQLVEALSHPNGWWRDTAQRLLVERGDKSVTPQLRSLALSAKASEPVRLKALWTMDGLNTLSPDIITQVLADASPKLRAAAIRLSEPFLAASDTALTARILKQATDTSREVRLQLALSLGEAPAAIRVPAMAGLLREDAEAPFLLAGIASGLGDSELAFIEHLLGSEGWRMSAPGYVEVFQVISAAVAQGGKSEQIDRLLQVASDEKSAPAWQRLALLNGLKASSWKKVAALPPALTTAAKSADPEIAKTAKDLSARLVWPGKFGAEGPPLTAAEQQLFEKGRTTYNTLCAACHQPDGRGLPGVAAPLVDSPWVLGPDEFLARIVLKGKTGKTTVTMPPLEMLSNEALAGALTYIRRSWGHSAAPVTPSTINEWREAVIVRSEPYTEAELEKLKASGGH